jgi:hypothetical protein
LAKKTASEHTTGEGKKEPWWKSVPARARAPVAIEKLSFDRQNPRFTPDKRPEGNSDNAIIAQLVASADLGELVQSISAGGYVDIEPLIAIGRDNELVVLEGNRRLGALKALKDPTLASNAKITIPAVPSDKKASLDEVSVYRVEQESEARDLIGFKHINGPQPWDAYAKARYAARWLDIERAQRNKDGSGLTISDIAHRMGDKHDTIYRIVAAEYVLEQAEEERLFAVSDRARKGFAFSHLYTAITYPEYRDFIGLAPADRRSDPAQNPVPETHFNNLRVLLRWLYGSRSEKIEPQIRSQNPDLAKLKKVLGDPRSRRVMLERNNLEEALESTITSLDRFEKSLVDADEDLRRAQASLDGYDGRDVTLLEIGRSVLDKARTVYGTMANVRQIVVDEEAQSGE